MRAWQSLYPGRPPGDRAWVRIVKAAKNYAFGRLESLVVASPSRVEPDCPVFAQCGGCCYRHISYEAELAIKEERVRDALTRIGGFEELPLSPIVGAASRDGYRNKALLPLGLSKSGGLTLGFYAPNSHRIVDCESCRLQPPVFNRAMGAFRSWAAQYGDPVYEEESHSGRMRRLYLRLGEETGEVLACVVVNGNGLHHEAELVQALRKAVPGLKSVVINSNRDRTNVALGKRCRTAWGSDAIEDTLCGLRFRISPLSFYQVNPHPGGAPVRAGGPLRRAHRGGTPSGPVLRHGDHRALHGPGRPAGDRRGGGPPGGGKRPGERPDQRH